MTPLKTTNSSTYYKAFSVGPLEQAAVQLYNSKEVLPIVVPRLLCPMEL